MLRENLVLTVLVSVLAFPALSLAEEWGKPLTTFDKADTNKDGKIDKDEYNRIVIDNFHEFDLNKDGYLGLEEMDEGKRRFLMSDKEKMIQNRIKEEDYLRKYYQPFNHFDLNKDGALAPDEYRGWGL